MPIRAVLALCLTLAASPAFAQAFGSVHCKAALRQIEVDQTAAQKRVDATKAEGGAKACGALNVNVLTLDHAREVYGSCTADAEQSEKLARVTSAKARTDDALLVQGCK